MKRVNARERFDEIRAEKRVPIGTFVFSIDPSVTAAAASVGVDFVVIDREHGQNDTITTANHIRAAEANGAVPIVRVLTNDSSQIQATLDIGAHGIIVPKVETATQAAQAYAATQYRPGGRGMCPAVEGARWSTGDAWFAHRESSNENVLLIPLIETLEGVKNLADIVGVDGIHYVFFGPADLSQDMDLPGGIYNPDSMAELTRIWDEAVATVHGAGKKIGGPAGMGLQGSDFGMIEADFQVLTTGYKERLDAFRLSERERNA